MERVKNLKSNKLTNYYPYKELFAQYKEKWECRAWTCHGCIRMRNICQQRIRRERSRGVERERGGCGDNRDIDSTRDTPGCFRGLNSSSTTFDNFDNANYKTTDRATTTGSSLKISSPAEQSLCAILVSDILSYLPTPSCRRKC